MVVNWFRSISIRAMIFAQRLSWLFMFLKMSFKNSPTFKNGSKGEKRRSSSFSPRKDSLDIEFFLMNFNCGMNERNSISFVIIWLINRHRMDVDMERIVLLIIRVSSVKHLWKIPRVPRLRRHLHRPIPRHRAEHSIDHHKQRSIDHQHQLHHSIPLTWSTHAHISRLFNEHLLLLLLLLVDDLY